MPVKFFQERNSAVLGVFLVLAIGVSLAWQARAYAQVVGATLSGTVTDTSGATVPNAQVTIKNLATGVERVVTVDSAGFYTAPNLLPGNYEVRISAAGFKTAVNSNVTLTVGAQQALNVSLQVGQINQQVVVTSEAPTVELASSSLDATVEAPTIVALPLNGRSWTDLANLQPGVSGIETQVPFGDSARGNRGFGAQLSISGSRPTQNNYRLDGISINDYANGGPGSVLGGNLGVDAVEEFSVLTSSYSAEYGKTSGGIVNAISRPGTNSFHGNGYEFIRNSALDARNFFDPPKIPAFHRNQFGGSIGGPIRKDKTFFFADYEGIRQSKGVGRTDVVPSLAARGLMADGKTHTPAMLCSNPPPATPSNPNPCKPSAPDYSGYAGTNVTPNPDSVTGIDKHMMAYLPIYPLPDPTGSSAGNIGNGDVSTYTFVGHRIVREDFFTTRVDHHFSQKDSVFATYMFDRTPFTTDEPEGVVLLGAITKRQIVAVEETHTFKPSLVNTVRLGYNRDFVNNNEPLKALLTAAGDPSLAAVPGSYAPGCTCPDNISFVEGGLGGTPTYHYRWNSYQVYDDAFLTTGRHSLKFGFGYERDQNNELTTGNRTGTFAFKDVNALLTNQPKKLRATPPGLLTERSLRQSIVGAYFQDDWRVRPSLTLNLGLRYEMATVPFDTQGQTSNLYNLTDTASFLLGTPPTPTPAAAPHCGKPNPACIGTGPYFYNPTLHDFAPRVGFAWDPFHSGKTAVRGGFGLFDSEPLLYQYLTLIGQAAPFFQVFAAGGLPVGSFPSQAFNIVATSGASNSQFAALETHPKRNYVMQWNFNIQREIFRDLTATIGYVGSHGVHQPFRVDDGDLVMPTLTPSGYLWPQVDVSGNQCIPNTQCAQVVMDSMGNPLPPPKLNNLAGDIRYLNWAASSFYNALQLGVLKKLNHGFQIQGSFTWAKSLDNDSGVVAGDQFSNSISSLDWFDLRLTRGPSDFNIGRTLVINATWVVPTPKPLSGAMAWPLSGWELSTIFKTNDGVPFSALFASGGPDPRGTLSSDDYAYPNVVAGCNPINLNFRSDSSGQPLYINHDSSFSPMGSCFTMPVAPNPTFFANNCDPAPPSLGYSFNPANPADKTWPGLPKPSAAPSWLPPYACFNLRGNVGRNALVGPGLMNLDFLVSKNNYIKRISESFNVQFRAEFFNILNHANFNVPDLGSGNTNMLNGDGSVNGGAGLLTQTTTDPREIQFAIKIIF